MRVAILLTLLLATAFAGCTDSDADNIGGNLDLGAATEVLVDVGDALGTLNFADDVSIPPSPSQDELCQIGSMGVGQTSWTIPDTDPVTGAAWIASSAAITVSAGNAAAGFTYVLEVQAEDGTTLATETAEQGASEVTATLTDAEAGTYDLLIHLCQGAAQLTEQAEGAAFSVAGQAEMVATETLYGSASASASADAEAEANA